MSDYKATVQHMKYQDRKAGYSGIIDDEFARRTGIKELEESFPGFDIDEQMGFNTEDLIFEKYFITTQPNNKRSNGKGNNGLLLPIGINGVFPLIADGKPTGIVYADETHYGNLADIARIIAEQTGMVVSDVYQTLKGKYSEGKFHSLTRAKVIDPNIVGNNPHECMSNNSVILVMKNPDILGKIDDKQEYVIAIDFVNHDQIPLETAINQIVKEGSFLLKQYDHLSPEQLQLIHTHINGEPSLGWEQSITKLDDLIQKGNP